jgi:hypothetical protein
VGVSDFWMIAFIKLWIIVIIVFENYFFMHYFDYLTRMVRMGSQEIRGFELINRKFYLTLFSIIRLAKAVQLESTYQSVSQFGTTLFYSPFILVLYIWWMEL